MKKLLFAVLLTFVSINAQAISPVYPAAAVAIGGGAVLFEAFTKTDPDALKKCATQKKAKDGNYSYTVYTKEACKK